MEAPARQQPTPTRAAQESHIGRQIHIQSPLHALALKHTFSPVAVTQDAFVLKTDALVPSFQQSQILKQCRSYADASTQTSSPGSKDLPGVNEDASMLVKNPLEPSIQHQDMPFQVPTYSDALQSPPPPNQRRRLTFKTSPHRKGKL